MKSNKISNNKSHREAKIKLKEQYGTRCWICKRNVGKAIQYHHIIPKYAGGSADDIRNGSLVCPTCHVKIHYFVYGTPMYERSIKKLLDYKRQNKAT